MSESKEPGLDKGCVFVGIAGSIFFMVPIFAWWWPVVVGIFEWVRKGLGF